MQGVAGRALILAAVVVAAVPAGASAAQVSLKQIDLGARVARGPAGTWVMVYRAGRGEANDVGVDTDGFKIKIGDKGATIKAGAHCDRLTKHKAVCDVPMTRPARRLDLAHPARANLGNGDDRITGDGVFWNRLKGGNGDDVLRGGSFNDLIIGGTGSDLIDGRGADQDVASYQGRPDDLRITMRKSTKRNDGGRGDGPPGKRDRIRRIEVVTGGKGDDVLRGTNAGESLLPLGGEDTVFALGGDDFIDLGSLPATAPDNQADEVDCGQGDDDVQSPGGEDTLTDCE